MGICGLLMAALSMLMAKKNRYVLFLSAVALLSLLVALGDHFVLYRILFDIVPGFSRFRGVARIMSLATFAAAILSGFGLRAIFEADATNRRRIEMFFAVAAALVVCVWISIQLGAFIPDASHPNYELIRAVATHEAMIALVTTLVVCGTAVLVLRGRIRPVAALAALFVLQYVDMSVFGFEQNNGSYSADDYYRDGREMVPALREDGKKELFRVTARKGQLLLMDRNQGMVDRIYLTEGYTPLALKRNLPPAKDWDAAYDLLNSKYRIAVNEQAQQISIARANSYMPRALSVFDVRVINDDSLIAAFMRSAEFDPERVVVLEETPSLPVHGVTGDSTHTAITAFNNNSMTLRVNSAANGIVLLSEIYYPGWNAYVDGERRSVLRADWSLRAVPVEAGSHDLVVKFEPASFRAGAMITAATLLLSCGILAMFGIRKGQSR
jgi:hypothetical protein